MSVIDSGQIEREAYEIAWQQFHNMTGLSPDELALGPNRIRQFIQITVAGGETNPEKVASAAVGLFRQSEQIVQSKARLTQS